MFFFLANIRATVIAALSIPTSIIAAFAIVQYMGFTLNSITLLALTLSVGIVIDDAIVVMENIFRYIEEKKYSPYEAAIAATGEIGLAVMAITLSLVAVFLPIAMMEGIVGRFLKSFGITMSATILVSMLVSFTLTPMLAARWFKGPAEDGNDDAPDDASGDGPSHAAESKSKNQFFYHVIEQAYLVAAAVLAAASLDRGRWPWSAAWPRCRCCSRMVTKNFIPDDDSSEFQVNVQAPEGTSLEATQVLIARIARDIRQLDGVRVHDRQRGRHRAAQSLPGHDLRPAGQHRRPRATASWR